MVKKHTKTNPEMGDTGGVVEKEAAIADQIKYKVEEDRKIDEAKRMEDLK